MMAVKGCVSWSPNLPTEFTDPLLNCQHIFEQEKLSDEVQPTRSIRFGGKVFTSEQV